MPRIIVKDHKYYFKIRGLGGPKGDKGDTGPAGPQGPQGPYVNVVAGTTTTLPAGSSAQVTVNNIGNTSTLNFGIPQGSKGDKGDAGTPGAQGPRGFAATVNVGETTTGQPGTNASVVNAGNEHDAVLKFTIPKGEKGETGETGPQGPTGGVKSTVVTELPETGESDKYYLVYRDSEGGTITTTDGYAQVTNDENGGDLTVSQLLGNAEQTTYSGKNLLDFDTATLYTDASVDSTRQGNGFKSTIKSVALPTYYNLNVTMPAGTYTLSFEARCQNSNSLLLNTQGYIFGGRGALKDASGATASESYRTLNSTWKKFSFTITTTASMAFTAANALHLYFIAPDNTQVFELQNPMFEAGSSATEYEQYVGGTPAPNPSYPQPISTVTGAQTITVTGKNLLGLQDDTLTSNGVNFAINNGTITASGTTTAGSNAENDNIIGDLSRSGNYPVYANITEANSIELRAGTYTVSAEITKTGETSAGIAFGTGATMGARITGLTKLEVSINDATGTYTRTATLTIAEGERLYVSTYYEGNATKKNVGFTISNIQLELGTQASDYEPYQGQSYTIDLDTLEFAKIGNYQDRIYKDEGKWYIEKQVGKATFDGSSDESWTLSTTGYLRYPFGIDIVGKGWASSTIDGVTCDTFLVDTSSEADTTKQNMFTCRGTNWSNRMWFFCPKSAIAGSTSAEILASYKTFLSTHPTTVYYALETPTTTEITDETLLLQLNFLASLYEGENNISLVGTGAQGEFTGDYIVYDKYNKHQVYIWSSDDNTWQIIVQ